MDSEKVNIFKRLRNEILPLQGYKSVSGSFKYETGLGPLLDAFPRNEFPVGAVHECVTEDHESSAATSGFITAIAGKLMKNGGVSLWINSHLQVFPPSLYNYGVKAENIIFLHLEKDKEILWAAEEALRCASLTSVIAEVPHLSFTASRRLQLAVENSNVTGFIIRKKSKTIHTTSCVCRWRITHAKSSIEQDLPGVGFQSWKVDLLKVRNGTPGCWTIKWVNGAFEHEYSPATVISHEQRKTG